MSWRKVARMLSFARRETLSKLDAVAEKAHTKSEAVRVRNRRIIENDRMAKVMLFPSLMEKLRDGT